MKQLQHTVRFWAQALAVAGLWLGVCAFCFFYTGHTVFQVSLCLLFSIGFSALLLYYDRSGRSIGLAQLLFVVLWLICALGYQLRLQIQQGWQGYWIYCFYFDSLLTQGTIWLGSTLCFTAFRLFCPLVNGKSFFRLSSAAFAVFYTFLLVYSFYLVRTRQDGITYPLNLNWLSTVQMYREQLHENPYEMWMMILGNLFYFTPLGYLTAVLLRRCPCVCRVLIPALLGPVVFFALEYSQYRLQIGYCEIDDMAMNTLGFWLGTVLAPLSDRFTKHITKQRLQHFWELK